MDDVGVNAHNSTFFAFTTSGQFKQASLFINCIVPQLSRWKSSIWRTFLYLYLYSYLYLYLCTSDQEGCSARKISGPARRTRIGSSGCGVTRLHNQQLMWSNAIGTECNKRRVQWSVMKGIEMRYFIASAEASRPGWWDSHWGGGGLLSRVHWMQNRQPAPSYTSQEAPTSSYTPTTTLLHLFNLHPSLHRPPTK